MVSRSDKSGFGILLSVCGCGMEWNAWECG